MEDIKFLLRLRFGEAMDDIKFVLRLRFKEAKERLLMWVAWRLPRKLAMWSAIRVITHATTGKYGGQIIPDLTAMDALERWEE